MSFSLFHALCVQAFHHSAKLAVRSYDKTVLFLLLLAIELIPFQYQTGCFAGRCEKKTRSFRADSEGVEDWLPR
jgi:hypothetical protein